MNSIRGRLSMWIAGSSILLAVVAGVLAYTYVHTAMLQQFDAGLSVRVRTLAALLRVNHEGLLAMDFSQESMPEFLSGKKSVYFQAFFPDGQTFERSVSLQGALLVDFAQVDPKNGAWDLPLPDGRPGRAIAILGSAHSEAEDLNERPSEAERAQNQIAVANAPRILFVAAHDRSELDRLSSVLFWALVVTTTGLAIACLIVVRLIVTRELRPLERLAVEATSIGAETLAYRFNLAGVSEELRPIHLCLNDLLERLDAAFKRERRINADIAHELRTPISELRALTEVAAIAPFEVPKLLDYLGDAHGVAIRMESIVETLLAIARSQSPRDGLLTKPLALASLIRSILDRAQSEITRRKLEIDVRIPEAQEILTDHLIFQRIIDNLTANAVQYSPSHSSIEFRSDPGPEGTIILKISNTNDSLRREDLDDIFQPFWRKDVSRTDVRRSGLGLVLVREYAKLLGITVTASFPKDDRFEIAIQLPVIVEANNAMSAEVHLATKS